jgi:hypothetical protein
MLNPQYLSASRHGIYYFRFTIPQALHPQHKASCLRVSLNTRCPRESLQLSRMLGYAGDQFIRHAGIQGMEYQQIRAVLQEHFGSLIDRRKQHQALHGSMQAMDRTVLLCLSRMYATPNHSETEDYHSSVCGSLEASAPEQ